MKRKFVGHVLTFMVLAIFGFLASGSLKEMIEKQNAESAREFQAQMDSAKTASIHWLRVYGTDRGFEGMLVKVPCYVVALGDGGYSLRDGKERVTAHASSSASSAMNKTAYTGNPVVCYVTYGTSYEVEVKAVTPYN